MNGLSMSWRTGYRLGHELSNNACWACCASLPSSAQDGIQPTPSVRHRLKAGSVRVEALIGENSLGLRPGKPATRAVIGSNATSIGLFLHSGQFQSLSSPSVYFSTMFRPVKKIQKMSIPHLTRAYQTWRFLSGGKLRPESQVSESKPSEASSAAYARADSILLLGCHAGHPLYFCNLLRVEGCPC